MTFSWACKMTLTRDRLNNSQVRQPKMFSDPKTLSIQCLKSFQPLVCKTQLLDRCFKNSTLERIIQRANLLKKLPGQAYIQIYKKSQRSYEKATTKLTTTITLIYLFRCHSHCHHCHLIHFRPSYKRLHHCYLHPPLLSLPRQIPRPRPTATQHLPTTHFGGMTKTKPEKDQILEDIDTAIYVVPEPPKQGQETPGRTLYLQTLKVFQLMIMKTLKSYRTEHKKK